MTLRDKECKHNGMFFKSDINEEINNLKSELKSRIYPSYDYNICIELINRRFRGLEK